MLTRSQTKQVIQMFLFNIDFDEASNAWTKNKIKQPNGCYKYRCMGQTQTGLYCKRRPLIDCDFCKIHYKSESKI